MKYVFELTHTRELLDFKEDCTYIGTYSSEEEAEKALNRNKQLAKFSDCIEGFNIDSFELNKDHWTEGYVTYSDVMNGIFYEGILPFWLSNLKKSKEDEKPEWEQTLKVLEQRIANQEKERKEEKELRRKILNQNKSLKNALKTEKNKTIWRKLFG